MVYIDDLNFVYQIIESERARERERALAREVRRKLYDNRVQRFLLIDKVIFDNKPYR